MLATLRRLFSGGSPPSIPKRAFVIYAHAPDSEDDLSSPIESFDPPFFPSDKIDRFSAEKFSAMAKVFRNADEAVAHLNRCTQPEMVPCVVYRLEEQRWVPDERATDSFHKKHINF